MLRGILGRLTRTGGRSRVVGTDRAGNTYVEVDHEEPSQPPRRQVQYKDQDWNPKSVPVLWWRWLNYTDDSIPTPNDLDRWEAEQAALKIRVQELEQADAKLRLEMIAQEQRDGFQSFRQPTGYFEGVMKKMRDHDSGAEISEQVGLNVTNQQSSAQAKPQTQHENSSSSISQSQRNAATPRLIREFENHTTSAPLEIQPKRWDADSL